MLLRQYASTIICQHTLKKIQISLSKSLSNCRVPQQISKAEEIYLFNHDVEFALKDPFRIISFEETDLMLHKLSELRELSEAYDKTQFPNAVKQQERAGYAIQIEPWNFLKKSSAHISIPHLNRFSRSKMSRDLQTCKETEKCQFYH